MNRITLILLLISSSVLADDQAITITDIKSDLKKAIEQKKETSVGDIRAGGTVNGECRIQSYKGLYSNKTGISTAKRDFSEKRVKFYGFANGIGPAYPGERCARFKGYETVVLWPTYGCKHDLNLKDVIAFASAYNSTMYGLVCREGT